MAQENEEKRGPRDGWVPVLRAPRRGEALAGIGVGLAMWRALSEYLPPTSALAAAGAFTLMILVFRIERLEAIRR